MKKEMKTLYMKKIKAELMLFALHRDYFGYGTIVNKLKSGKYKVHVDGETTYYTKTQLAKEWDTLDKGLRKDIVDDFAQSCLY